MISLSSGIPRPTHTNRVVIRQNGTNSGLQLKLALVHLAVNRVIERQRQCCRDRRLTLSRGGGRAALLQLCYATLN